MDPEKEKARFAKQMSLREVQKVQHRDPKDSKNEFGRTRTDNLRRIGKWTTS
jgi:hypothetical protein